METTRSSQPVTAFVLAGGGSLGAVHVGILQVLIDAGISPDLVVGASAGAINGVHLAAEPNARGVTRLGETWRRIGLGDIFPISPTRSIRALQASALSFSASS